MSTEEVFGELRKLSRVNKLRAMEILVLELAAEEESLLSTGTEYEVWSPFDSPAAAQSLTKLLEQDKEARSG